MKNFIKILFFFLILLADSFPQLGLSKDLLQIESFQSFDKVYPGGEFKIALKINIDKDWHINSNKPYEDYLIPTEISIEKNEIFSLTKESYPEAHDFRFAFSDKPLSVYEGEIYVGGLVKLSGNISPGEYELVLKLNYQACNNSSCLPPSSIKDTLKIIVADKQSAVSEINQNIFNNIDLSYSTLEVNNKSDENDPVTSALERSGIFLGLILVFLGGLALNLTPCVYPLIPITIGYFGGQTEGSTKKLFLMGLMFLIGMSITYSVIGVITALSGAVFGSLLQNTFVIIFIVLIFITLSLSMFGVYEFKMPDKLVAKAGGAKSGYYGALFMGLTMGIVAAPCIGPFVLGLVTYVAAKADPLYGLLLFFILSLGLGFPYLFLAVFSGKIKKLPRAGEWMESVKHIFGFILLGMALYFILPLLPDTFSGYVLPVYMILVALYLLLFEKTGKNIAGFRIFKIAFSILILAIGIYAVFPSDSQSVNWQPYSVEIYPAAFENKNGVIIDFYADWCIPCKELDALTFSDPKVIEASKNFYTFKADMTKSLSPEVEELKEKYNIIGVPTVLVIDSKGNEVKRITGFVNAEEFYNIISNVN